MTMTRHTVLLAILLALLFPPLLAAGPARADFTEGRRAFEQGNFIRAFGLAYIEAKKGNAEAQTYVGVMFQYGQGTRQDAREAARWYTQAAEQDYLQAQINLGALYATGTGVPRNLTEALKWFTIAAQRPGTVAEQNRLLAKRTMTKKQVAEGERRAAQWLKAKGREVK